MIHYLPSFLKFMALVTTLQCGADAEEFQRKLNKLASEETQFGAAENNCKPTRMYDLNDF